MEDFNATSINCGRLDRAAAAKSAVGSVFRAAGDKLAAASMRLHRRRGSVVPPSLTEAWREAAGAEAPPSSAALEELCGHTLAEWSSLSWADCVLVFDAWGFMAQQHGASFALPRPLLRLMGTAAWQHGKTASLAELNLVAARCAPFMRGSSSADLVRSVLDAIIHAAAKAAKLDGKAALSLGAVTGMAPWASRTPAVQRDLLLLRQAASTARDPAEEMLAAKVGVVKLQLRCDSITAASHVAHSLARDSLQNGGDMKATFKRAFGVVPEGMEEEQAAAEDGGGGDEGTSLAISEWQLRALSLEAAAAEAAGAAAAGSGASQEEEQSAATGDVQPRAVAASE